MFQNGNRVVVVEYPEPLCVGVSGTVINAAYDEDAYIEVRLDLAPEVNRPWVTDYLFYEGEIELIQ